MKKQLLSEAKVGDMTKEELKNFIKDIVGGELDKDKNKPMTEAEVKKIVRGMLLKFYKNLWTNAPFYFDRL